MALAGTLDLTGSLAIEAPVSFRILIQLEGPDGNPIDLGDFDVNGLHCLMKTAIGGSTVFTLADNDDSGFPDSVATTATISGTSSDGVIELAISSGDTQTAQAGSDYSGVYDVIGRGISATPSDEQYRARLVEGNWALDLGVSDVAFD